MRLFVHIKCLTRDKCRVGVGDTRTTKRPQSLRSSNVGKAGTLVDLPVQNININCCKRRDEMAPSTLVIDQTTVTSLLAALSLLIVSYAISIRLLPAATTTSTRVLFIWHSFDSLIHFLFEGSFLYNCFTIFTPRTILGKAPLELHAPGVYFLGIKDRIYGSAFGTTPTALLWQE
jgi:hypothetical protein